MSMLRLDSSIPRRLGSAFLTLALLACRGSEPASENTTAESRRIEPGKPMRIQLRLQVSPKATAGDLELELLDVVEAAVERDGRVEHVPAVSLRVTRGRDTQIVDLEHQIEVFGHDIRLYMAADDEVALDVTRLR
jgi:hypothetical protein